MPYRPAISSHSLGRAWVHDLPSKLDAAASYDLDIELFYEDLHYLAQTLPGGPTPANQLEAARMIRSMCSERGIDIVCLQPFMHYEGLRDRERHARRVEEMKLWIQIAKALDTGIIAIPSTFLAKEEVCGDLDVIVEDMREVAALAAKEGLQIAYESLAWGTYADTWEAAWEVVRRVNRPNFGLCLDTFNMAARVFADPAAPSGRNPKAVEDMRASLERLVKTVDVRKIVYVQVVDAERLSKPLVAGHPYYRREQPARMSWSRNCRLFYGEESRGAYLPIKDILRAILHDLGYEGWISAELFNISLTDPSPEVPQQHSRRAAESWRKIVNDFDLAAPSCERRASVASIKSLPRAVL